MEKIEVKRPLTTNESIELMQILAPELIDALLDFKRQKANGVIEVHFSLGGIAKVFGKPTKMYK